MSNAVEITKDDLQTVADWLNTVQAPDRIKDIINNLVIDAKEFCSITMVSFGDIESVIRDGFNGDGYSDEQWEEIRQIVQNSDLEDLARDIRDNMFDGGPYWETIETWIDFNLTLPEPNGE